MSDSPLGSPAADNPYRAPVSSSEPAPPETPDLDPWRRLEASNLLRKLRGCYRGLGAIHCFFAAISVAIGGVGFIAMLEAPEPNAVIYVTLALLALTLPVYLALGIGAFFFRSWAAWGTIGYVAFSLGLDLLFGDLRGCSVIFAVVYVALAISIVLFERKLKAFGVSKNAAMRHGMIASSVDPVIRHSVKVPDVGSAPSSAFREISGDGAAGK